MKKLAKRLAFFLVFLSCFVLFGCNGERFVVFSTKNPSYGLKKSDLVADFQKGQRVYFSIISPKGFEDDLIKIVIFKKDAKSEFWGYSNLYNKTVQTGGKQYYYDYIAPSEAGFYVVRVFEMKNLQKQIATGMFRVND